MYTCAICGKEYDTIEARAKCESKCLADEKKKAEAMKAKKKIEERERYKKTVLDALNSAEEALKVYFSEYEGLILDKNNPYLKLVFDHNTWFF